MASPKITSFPAKQTGLSLIEILVTVIVTSIGLLGLAALQNLGLKASYNSYLRTQSSFIASDLADRIRANPEPSYELAAGTNPTQHDCFSTETDKQCSNLEIRDFDLFYWHQSVQNLLPGAVASVALAEDLYSITLKWENRSEDASLETDSDDFFDYEYHFKVNN